MTGVQTCALPIWFAAIAHGQPINAQQFEADALKKYHDREMKIFRRADWNNDGAGDFLLKKASGLCQIESVTVHDELKFSGVFGDGDDALNGMTALPEGLNDEVNIYHA